MIRTLLLAAVIVALGCNKNTSAVTSAEDASSGGDSRPTAATGTPPADSAPAPDLAAGNEEAPAGDPVGDEVAASDDAVEVAADDRGGGRMAKPGWCNQDGDCRDGQVCEKCGAEGKCVPGCHENSQCAEGEYCNRVQCIRCPCPGICEPKA